MFALEATAILPLQWIVPIPPPSLPLPLLQPPLPCKSLPRSLLLLKQLRLATPLPTPPTTASPARLCSGRPAAPAPATVALLLTTRPFPMHSSVSCAVARRTAICHFATRPDVACCDTNHRAVVRRSTTRRAIVHPLRRHSRRCCPLPRCSEEWRSTEAVRLRGVAEVLRSAATARQGEEANARRTCRRASG